MSPSERYHRITGIFIAVCNLEDAERKQALESLCADCPDLRSEVELLLTFHDQLAAVSGRKRSPSNGPED